MIREAIKARLIETGISQAELARRVGCRKNTINDFLTGKSQLTSKILENVLKLLDLKIK